MKTLALFLICAGIAVATGNTCTSNLGGGTGNSSSGATWLCVPSGSIPGDGDYAIVANGDTVVINANIGTLGSGLKNLTIQTGGHVTFDGGAPRTLLFGSTGTDPIGTGGTLGGPSAFATMYGINLCSGSFDTSAGSATNYLTIGSATANPWYAIHVYSACGLFGQQGTFNFTNAWLKNLGANVGAAAEVAGISMAITDTPSMLTISNVVCQTCYQFVYEWPIGASISNSYVYGRTGPSTFGAGQALDSIALTKNTEMGAAANGSFVSVFQNNGFSYMMTGNAFLDNATYTGTMFNLGAYMGATETDTVASNVGIALNATAGTTVDGVSVPQLVASTSSATVAANYFDGWRHGINVASTSGLNSSGNVLVANSGSASGQGAYFGFGSTAITSTADIIALDTSNGNDGLFILGQGVIAGAAVVDKMTTAMLANNTNGTAIQFGEPGTLNNVTTSVLRNSIAYRSDSGVSNGSTSNAFSSDITVGGVGVGVHHNDAAANFVTAYTPSGAQGAAFDNAVTAHASAIYGDQSIAPIFAGGTNGRRAVDYDRYIGGPGTLADLFSGFAAARTTLPGLPGVTTPVAPLSLYDPVLMVNFVRVGFAPVGQVIFATAGQESGSAAQMGAVAPICTGCMIP